LFMRQAFVAYSASRHKKAAPAGTGTCQPHNVHTNRDRTVGACLYSWACDYRPDPTVRTYEGDKSYVGFLGQLVFSVVRSVLALPALPALGDIVFVRDQVTAAEWA
jgi:hypothetical protein